VAAHSGFSTRGIPKLTQVFGLYRILRRLAFANLMGRSNVEGVTQELAEDLKGKILQDISLPPLGPSPAEHYRVLSQLDYPFRVEGPGAMATGGTKSYQVHHVTGKLRESLKIEKSIQEDRTVFRVGFDIDIAPWAVDVLVGTSKMQSRDVLGYSLRDIRAGAGKKYRSAIKKLTELTT